MASAGMRTSRSTFVLFLVQKLHLFHLARAAFSILPDPRLRTRENTRKRDKKRIALIETNVAICHIYS